MPYIAFAVDNLLTLIEEMIFRGIRFKHLLRNINSQIDVYTRDKLSGKLDKFIR